MKHYEYHWQSPEGLRIHGQGWEPEGELRAAVCLVHGLGEHSGRYAHVAEALTGAGYTLVTYDQRGHGRSQGIRGHAPSYDAVMGDIDRLLEEATARYPDRPRFLYGHSLGGNQVLYYALQRRPAIAGVIATGPLLRPTFELPAWKVRLGKLLYRFAPQVTMANGLDRDGLSHDPAVVAAYKADPLVHDRVSARAALDMLEAGRWVLAHAGDFPLPLLLMHGGADRLCAAAASGQFADRAPGTTTFRRWEGLYHEIHNEPQQGEVLALMIDWLNAHLPTPAAAAAGTPDQVAGIAG